MRHLICLLLLLPAVAHSGDLEEFTAEYSVEKAGFEVAVATMQLQMTQENIYKYTSHSKAVGMLSLFVDDKIDETSLFVQHGNTFKPVSYRYVHSGSSKNRNQSIDYDWQSMAANINYRGEKNRIELRDGTVDRFLLPLVIGQDLQDSTLDQQYRVLDRGRVKDFNLIARGRETIKTPAGTFETLVVERDDDDKKTTRFWLATENNYLLVKVEQSEMNEESLRMTLTRLR